MANPDTTSITSGSCGQNVRWSLIQKEDTILIIEGAGFMTDYAAKENTPFHSLRNCVTKILIKPGILNIGNYAFADFTALKCVKLPETLEHLGCCVFSSCTVLEKIELPEGLRIIGPKAFEKCTALTEICLPSTLKAIDFKAFINSANLQYVKYAGTKAQWERQVCISKSSQGNCFLINAKFTFTPFTLKYEKMLANLADIIEKGGNGLLYIVTPDLTVENSRNKSGDCSLIIFPNGQTMLIDSGYTSSEELVLSLLQKLNIRNLDCFVLSHAHIDHLGNGMAMAKYLFEQAGGSIKNYYYSGLEYKDKEKRFVDYLSEHCTQLHRSMRAGDKLSFGGVEISFFNPFDTDMNLESFDDASVNNVSLVMKFTYGCSTYLTAGDLYAKREALLVEKYGNELQSDIAKTNHHGIFTSNTDIWYNALKSQILISNCDHINYTLFSEKLAANGIKHYKVSECGLVVISMNNQAGYHVETENS